MSRMKLYYALGACSLADHIELHEIGAEFDVERVNIRADKTESGAKTTIGTGKSNAHEK